MRDFDAIKTIVSIIGLLHASGSIIFLISGGKRVRDFGAIKTVSQALMPKMVCDAQMVQKVFPLLSCETGEGML